jgi:hypothetical protein
MTADEYLQRILAREAVESTNLACAALPALRPLILVMEDIDEMTRE